MASGSQAAALLDFDRGGLTVLPVAVPETHTVDYVFLHGLNGHPKNTWSHADGFYWPAQIAQDIPGARVLIYGYHAEFERALVENKITIKAIAQTFVSRLVDERKGELNNKPIILIAHSLGGLVIKRALISIHVDRNSGLETRKIQDQNAIYDSIAGLVFMGTPHAGSHISEKKRIKLLKVLAGATFKKPPEKLVKALAAHSDELLDLSDNFERITIFTKHEIEICTYYETRTTKFLGGEEVVPLAMAKLHYLNEREEPIYADHSDMVKFPSAQDGTYRSVKSSLEAMGIDGLKIKARQDFFSDQISFSIEGISMIGTTLMDPLTFTNRVLATVTRVTDALMSCRRHAVQSGLKDLSIASLHVGCLTVRLELRQVKSLMTRDGDNSYATRFEAVNLEEYDEVLQACFISFSTLNGYLAKLGLTHLKEMNQSVFLQKLQHIRSDEQMDTMETHIRDLSRVINILRTRFESETATKTYEITESPAAKEALANITSDAISLHESFQTASEIEEESTAGSIMNIEMSDLDNMLTETRLYQRVLARQRIKSQLRELQETGETDAAGASLSNALLELGIPPTYRSSTFSTDPGEHLATTTVEQIQPPRGGDPPALEQVQSPAAAPDSEDPAGVTDHMRPVVESAVQSEHRNSFDSESSDETARASMVLRRDNNLMFEPTHETRSKEDLDLSPSPARGPGTTQLPPGKLSRLPTLFEVLTRRTSKPYGLFEFYVYMRDIQKSVDYLDFWLDIAQHLSLCRHYVRHLHTSIMEEGTDESALDETDATVRREDLRASAEKILYIYLLPGSEREIILPQRICDDIVEAIEGPEQRADPELFDAAKDYVFQAMELDAFPGFLNLNRPLLRMFRTSKSLGPLVNRLFINKTGGVTAPSAFGRPGSGINRLPPEQLFGSLADNRRGPAI